MSFLAARKMPEQLATVIITTKTGQSIKGALVRHQRDALFLRFASVANVNPQGQITWMGLDGDTVVPMDNIDFWQDALDASLLDSIADAAERRSA